VRLVLTVEDRKGMLAALSAKVADINTNITSLEATTGDDVHATVAMTVEIRDLTHLEKVVRALRGVEGVLDVSRESR
jgi:(p)ppGpp synthase/HD superfamily hydrolase